MNKSSLVLASGSPRRKELLTQLGYEFSVLVTDIEEQQQPDEDAQAYVQRLSLDKAKAALNLIAEQEPNSDSTVSLGSDNTASFGSDNIVVLGSDTVVVSQGQVLEKPSDLADCKRMLTQLSDQRHQVMTAVSVVSADKHKTEIVITDV
ncbi:Maf family protein, partial [Vibrio fortis]